MIWTHKKQTINPIHSSVEIALLKQAYAAQPNNSKVLVKLIENLLLENQLDDALRICKNHQRQYPQDNQIYVLLTYLYRKTGDLNALIEAGETALQHSPRLDTRLQLAYAYAQRGQVNQVTSSIPKDEQCLAMHTNQLRLLLETHLIIRQAEQVIKIYKTLPASKQADSGLKSNYLTALHQLGKQTEIDHHINYQDSVKEYSLARLNDGLNIDKLNRELEAFFLSHPKQQYEPGNHTTRYGSQMHFESDWHPLLKHLEDEIKNAVELYLGEEQSLRSNTRQSFTLNLWSNILNKKGYQISHIHPDALVSGVYYVAVPTSVKESIKTINRHGYLLFSQSEATKQRYVRPENGLIVLFPSYFYHETLPLVHDETRICVAFDVVRDKN